MAGKDTSGSVQTKRRYNWYGKYRQKQPICKTERIEKNKFSSLYLDTRIRKGLRRHHRLQP
jgi:hypothetical protein